jgi:hypothetical protein
VVLLLLLVRIELHIRHLAIHSACLPLRRPSRSALMRYKLSELISVSTES